MKITFKGPGRPSMVSQELPAKIRMTLHNLQIAGCAISRKKQSLWLELECCNLNLQKYYWKMRALSSWQPNWLVASWSSWNDQSFKGQLQNVKWTQLFMESSNFLERNIMQFWCCSITFQGGGDDLKLGTNTFGISICIQSDYSTNWFTYGKNYIPRFFIFLMVFKCQILPIILVPGSEG